MGHYFLRVFRSDLDHHCQLPHHARVASTPAGQGVLLLSNVRFETEGLTKRSGELARYAAPP